jgi:hypothetical protein
MAATYARTSPYHGTPLRGPFLDIWAGKTIPADPSDAIYQIDPVYALRPDMLAYDLYGDSNLWWVFSVRNPSILPDPIMNFIPGVIIYAPTKPVVKAALGI